MTARGPGPWSVMARLRSLESVTESRWIPPGEALVRKRNVAIVDVTTDLRPDRLPEIQAEVLRMLRDEGSLGSTPEVQVRRIEGVDPVAPGRASRVPYEVTVIWYEPEPVRRPEASVVFKADGETVEVSTCLTPCQQCGYPIVLKLDSSIGQIRAGGTVCLACHFNRSDS